MKHPVVVRAARRNARPDDRGFLEKRGRRARNRVVPPGSDQFLRMHQPEGDTQGRRGRQFVEKIYADIALDLHFAVVSNH
jgi:hypothetical protein